MQEALEFCLKSISAKRQTVKEIREKLATRFPEADAEAVIARLQELEYLDDKAFAEAYIRHRSLSSPRGKWVLRQELRRKGVAESDYALALESFSEDDVITEVAEKKWEKLRNEPDQYKKKQKLLRFLVSRGFSMGECLEVVNSFASRPHS